MRRQIVDHNRAAAAAWDAGGSGYNQVSFAISDALAHATQRLAPRAGERVLDVATGTGGLPATWPGRARRSPP